MEVIRLGAWSREGEEGDVACLGQGTGRCWPNGLDLLKFSIPQQGPQGCVHQPARLHSPFCHFCSPPPGLSCSSFPPEPQSPRAPVWPTWTPPTCLVCLAQFWEALSSRGLAAGLGAWGPSGRRMAPSVLPELRPCVDGGPSGLAQGHFCGSKRSFLPLSSPAGFHVTGRPGLRVGNHPGCGALLLPSSALFYPCCFLPAHL